MAKKNPAIAAFYSRQACGETASRFAAWFPDCLCEKSGPYHPAMKERGGP
jgi:hypothetical protein